MGKRNNNEVYKVMFCLSVPPPGDLSPRYCPRQCEAGLAGVWWPHLRSASTTGAHIRPLSTLSTVYTPLPLSLLFSYPPSSSYTQHFNGGRSLLPSDAILLIIYISTTHLPYLIQIDHFYYQRHIGIQLSFTGVDNLLQFCDIFL